MTREQKKYLSQMGLGSGKINLVEDNLPDHEIERILTDNIFELCNISGIGFLSIDSIFLEKIEGKEKDPRRIEAALETEIQGACDILGHSAVTKEEICNPITGQLKYSKVPWKIVEHLIGKGQYSEEEKPPVAYFQETLQGIAIATRTTIEQEHEIASFLQTLHKKEPNQPVGLNKPTGTEKIKPNEKQAQAIKMAATSSVCILTGGPGTGKTTTLKGILNKIGPTHTKLCAFTGSAAQRMETQTGQTATTIHHLIGKLEKGQEQTFKNIIIDETSTLSIELMDKLVIALEKNKNLERIIFLGDTHQLPSIGHGCLLADLIASKKFPTTTLTQVMRISGSNPISDAANLVKDGEKIEDTKEPTTTPQKRSFTLHNKFTLSEQIQKIQNLLTTKGLEALQKNNGSPIDPFEDCMVIVPQKAGKTGRYQLNLIIQECLNPIAPSKKEFNSKYHNNGAKLPKGWIHREGDKVMITKNLPEKNVVNGQTGRIKEITANEVIFEKREGGVIAIPKSEAHLLLEPAYAITVHKSQGCESPLIILVLNHECPKILRQRNLLYTAITRSQNHCLILGHPQTIQDCLKNNTQNQRRTSLAKQLEQESKFSVGQIKLGPNHKTQKESLQEKYPEAIIELTKKETRLKAIRATTPKIAKKIKERIYQEILNTKPPKKKNIIRHIIDQFSPS